MMSMARTTRRKILSNGKFTENEKEYYKQMNLFRENCVQAIEAEVKSVIEKYAIICAEKAKELYKKHIKVEVKK
jgi:hypothetical protein